MELEKLCKQFGSMLHEVADMIIEADEAEQKEFAEALKADPKVQEILAKYKEESAADAAADKRNSISGIEITVGSNK